MDTFNLTTALRASIEAGKEIMKVYSQDFDVVTKDDESPLTIADQRANEIINSFLIKTEFPIISEENKQTDYSIRKDWETCWIVDPLDGTKEFVKRNGEFTVNIALVTNKKPVLGVIYVPVTKEIFYTSKDMSSSSIFIIDDINNYNINTIFKEAKEITPAILNDGEIIKIVGSRSHLNEDTQVFVEKKKEESNIEVFSKGSSVKFCLVAEGKAHFNVNTNLPLEYNKENLMNPFFLVSK